MKIQSKIKEYVVEITNDIFYKRDSIFSNLNYRRLFYFVDGNVSRFYGKQLSKFIGNDFSVIIEAEESNKEYVNLAQYYKRLIENDFKRADILVTIGGGILQDISGFIASTLYRGIKWVFIPTTLLAQADSCIGSKTSINFSGSKNLIGTFYPPDHIYIDSKFCNTLTNGYFNSGIGEIIKFHLMSDAERYKKLKKYLNIQNPREKAALEEIISSTLSIKKSYFDEDEFDTGRRNLLNYGHCFGHALESAANFAICHGEAVIVGMGFANLLSFKRGIMKEEKYNEFEDILRRYYPDFNLARISIDDLIKYLKRDKKRVGSDLTMILCKDIGEQLKCDDIKELEIRDNYSEFLKVYLN